MLEKTAKLPNAYAVLTMLALSLHELAAGILAVEKDRHETDSWTLADLRERVEELERRARVRESGYSGSSSGPTPPVGDGPSE